MILAYVILPALPHYLPLPALLLMTLHINSAIVGISQQIYRTSHRKSFICFSMEEYLPKISKPVKYVQNIKPL